MYPYPSNPLPTGRNDCYPIAINHTKAGPSFAYGYSTGTTLNNSTGNWIPFKTNSDGSLVVDIGVPAINVSGNLSLGAGVFISGGYIGLTGTPSVINLGGYIGITGSPLVTLGGGSASVLVTGLPPISLSGGYVGITGTVNTLNLGGYVGITGVSTVINLGGYVGVTGVPTVNVTGGSITSLVTGGYLGITGIPTVLNLGGYVGITGVATVQINDTFTSVTVSNDIPSGNGSMVTGLLFPANAARKKFYIQTAGTGMYPMYIKYGNPPVSTSSFNLILKQATSEFGADGGVLVEESYKGQVSISGNSRFISWEA